MILDYNFSKEKKEMCISYIDETGNKQLLQFKNLNKFSTYQYDPQGTYNTWNGCKASRKFTSNPNKFDIKEFIYNLSPELQSKLDGRTFPKLYSFDIETQIKSKFEFTDPTVADQPILTISLVNPDLDCIVLGTKDLDKNKIEGIQRMFDDYLKSVEFYNTLKLSKNPQFRYIKFDSEEKMIRYFFEKFVKKVPIIAGWNSIGYDWCYFVHRVKNFYPDLSITLSSINNTTTAKNYTNKLGETIKLQHPNHTLVLDMMEVIDNYDFSVLGMKESMNLDYVASQTLGAHKIDYEGSLQDLYEADYQRYVFYNAIDSILVQLIDKRFKTMNQFYLQGLICKESIGKCFSKIALTEALIFKHFYKEGIKIVYEEREDVERGELMGAYVKEPRAGKWEWMCCNDFASLYPSTMITCNISFENYMGKLGREFTEEDIERFKKDKKYFVSVNNNVYRNDKPYTLKVIEKTLKNERDVNKYLSKRLDATIKSDVVHFMAGQTVEYNEYPTDVKDYIKGILGIDINTTEDICKIVNITEFNDTLDSDITYFTGLEQAVKTLMNSIYGGSSHISFYFYNMDMANDITGESRWLIHKMESHIPEHFDKEWIGMKDLHKQLGIEVDEQKVKEYLKNKENMITLVYGDTDSVDSQSIIKTNKGEKTIEQLFLENEHNNKKITQNGHELVSVDDKILNYNAEGKLEYQNARYIMRHKVRKPKWRLKTATGKEIFVTNDHSMIVFRDGKKLEVKPYEILKTDKILVVK